MDVKLGVWYSRFVLFLQATTMATSFDCMSAKPTMPKDTHNLQLMLLQANHLVSDKRQKFGGFPKIQG